MVNPSTILSIVILSNVLIPRILKSYVVENCNNNNNNKNLGDKVLV